MAPGLAENEISSPNIILPQEWVDAANTCAYDSVTSSPLIIFVCGPKNSGKTTFSRYLLNVLLQRFDIVVFYLSIFVMRVVLCSLWSIKRLLNQFDVGLCWIWWFFSGFVNSYTFWMTLFVDYFCKVVIFFSELDVIRLMKFLFFLFYDCLVFSVAYEPFLFLSMYL